MKSSVKSGGYQSGSANMLSCRQWGSEARRAPARGTPGRQRVSLAFGATSQTNWTTPGEVGGFQHCASVLRSGAGRRTPPPTMPGSGKVERHIVPRLGPLGIIDRLRNARGLYCRLDTVVVIIYAASREGRLNRRSFLSEVPHG